MQMLQRKERVRFRPVADGMGGHRGGRTASRMAIEAMGDVFESHESPNHDTLRETMEAANTRIYDVASSHSELRGMGTTLVAMWIGDAIATLVNVGDSRIYQIRSGSVLKRSRDHSHVEVLIQEGAITEEEALDHPMRNFVECCLGGDAAVPDMSITAKMPLEPNDVLLACSDGLWSGLSDADVAQIGRPGDAELSESLKELSIQALNANSPHSDNTTGTALKWLGS
jgi:serine/threonine protein phosphatase PrpC